MKLKELHSIMQDIDTFNEPKVDLEQYPTGPEIASRMLFTIESVYDDFAGRTVVDLGCGTGMLGIGAALLGSCHVIGVDIDSDALDTAQGNLDSFEDLQMDLLQCSIAELERQPRLTADTVIMNPPFGTRRKGADLDFLRAAFRVSRGSVYSLHKTSTRAHIQRVAQKELSAHSAEVVAQLRYDLPASYAFHKERSRDIEVDLWRFEVPLRR
ncbi:S-adenosyl-L-methionine-dependent methyltransferase [Coccomyxa subellipsoidea C-169]|uniref:S-adenosyl-L-methionine-dependent methyltransferase n=1 Tax=Coccomyxa subellipsoidea (strain C-169) TaxID=574566 RepID=I0YJ83_COCSC|nr:S-adenosyl-L-methionine-dependent methyltransferase [Coccomyxa subellipsoidea C-169]EIE18452.1 S-adenosyl-L-methionine-dependent methyltransferase [Coccomyxa subellipsoidea C-169]|eukprot:XP_005642996.1 S-adenosyl-L-methionine-dependent methyltransferase [Coccomyxa subellipsoidea C-169]